MPTPSERYHAALADARERALVLTQEQERELLELLEEYAREIEARVAGGLRFGTDAAVLREIALLVDAMTGEMAASV
ncbi:MAG TPA: hypothetical protein VFI96_01755, partial [Longimicrobiaceae bacterium]|nr:hypothetical protein [Longimicrobiaceae bacterium]